MMLDARGRRLGAVLAAVLVKSDAQELRLVHDPTRLRAGIGLITVGVERHGMRLSLSHIADGEWRAMFMDDNARLAPRGFGGDAVGRGAAGGVGGRGQGETMTQLVRRASLAVVLLLFASVGTAFGACAWVLWVEQPSGSNQWSLSTSLKFIFETREECEQAASVALDARISEVEQQEKALGHRFDAPKFFQCLPLSPQT